MSPDERLSPWYLNLVPPLAEVLIRGLRRTLRLRVHGRETVERFTREGQRYIHVFWQAHILLSVYSYIGPDIFFLVSKSKDGELITRTMARFGYTMARGSSSSGGGTALREMLRAVRQGKDIGFTPDGPRGPARQVQPGTVIAARVLQIPIVPVALGARRAWVLNSWDRFGGSDPASNDPFACGFIHCRLLSLWRAGSSSW